MIRVLYIDDESSLLTLTQIYLKEEAGIDVEVSASASQGLAMLQASEYDAVISDYDMPEIDGIEFLKQVREYDLTIPFIVFTGKGREEVAIEALNNGADFYVQKGGEPRTIFAELANAIRHLVRRTHAERHATLTERQMRVFLDSLPDLAFIKGPDLRLLFINTAYMEHLGLLSPDDAVGKRDEDLLPPDLVHKCRISDEETISQKKVIVMIESFQDKAYQVRKFPLPFPDGMVGVGGIIREIDNGHAEFP